MTNTIEPVSSGSQKIEFIFQLPNQTHEYLLDRCAMAALGAVSGGGNFAWATASGANLFFSEPNIQQLLNQGNFELIVGTDTVTDEKAIISLTKHSQKNSNLKVSAMINPTNALFHPKVVWFETVDEIRVITGSGNLTFGGLKKNWEAFTYQVLRGSDAEQFHSVIKAWGDHLKDYLLPLDDAKVLDRVRLNAGEEWAPVNVKDKQVSKNDNEEPKKIFLGSVLVAEIPRSGQRWKQVNFDKETFEGYFDAGVGGNSRVLFWEVAEDGSLGELENRPAVAVVSQNYRFELSAARGDYPASGRPVGIFWETDPGEFLYQIIMPEDVNYADVRSLLDGIADTSAPARKLVRSTMPADAAVKAMPKLSIWKGSSIK